MFIQHPGNFEKIRMGSLLAKVISSIIPSWPRREETLTSYKEGRSATRAWGAEYLLKYAVLIEISFPKWFIMNKIVCCN